MSSACPSIILAVALERDSQAARRGGVVMARRARCASTRRASPARMAEPSPNTAQAVARWRRSPSRSITSSWRSEKLWTNSTATAPGSAVSAGDPAASAESSARAGRTALPPSPSLVRPSSSAKPKWYRHTRRTSGDNSSSCRSSFGATVRRARPRARGTVPITPGPPSVRHPARRAPIGSRAPPREIATRTGLRAQPTGPT